MHVNTHTHITPNLPSPHTNLVTLTPLKWTLVPVMYTHHTTSPDSYDESVWQKNTTLYSPLVLMLLTHFMAFASSIRSSSFVAPFFILIAISILPFHLPATTLWGRGKGERQKRKRGALSKFVIKVHSTIWDHHINRTIPNVTIWTRDTWSDCSCSCTCRRYKRSTHPKLSTTQFFAKCQLFLINFPTLICVWERRQGH